MTNNMVLAMAGVTGFFRLTGVAVQPPCGMVAWWSGDGDALDLVGTSHGTLMNGAGFAQGMVGQAFSFDGADDYVELPSLAGDFTEGTIECWFSLDSWEPAPYTGGGPYLWSCQGPEMGDIVGLGGFQSGAPLHFGIYYGTWYAAVSGVTPEVDTWYHVAGTWGPLGLRIFVNGQLLGVDPYTGPIPPPPRGGSTIGCGYWADSAIHGRVDELTLYSRALTAEEIKAIYDADSAGKTKPR
jgi:hypothetical protein